MGSWELKVMVYGSETKRMEKRILRFPVKRILMRKSVVFRFVQIRTTVISLFIAYYNLQKRRLCSHKFNICDDVQLRLEAVFVVVVVDMKMKWVNL